MLMKNIIANKQTIFNLFLVL